MTTEDPHHTPPPLPPLGANLPLEYGHSKRTNSAGSVIGRIVISFVGYVVISVAWFGFANGISPNSDLALGGWFFITLALLGTALFVRIRYKRAGYGYGILMALGLGMLILVGLLLLIIGLCFHSKPGGGG